MAMRGRTLHVIPYLMGPRIGVLQAQRRCPHGAMHFHLHTNRTRLIRGSQCQRQDQLRHDDVALIAPCSRQTLMSGENARTAQRLAWRAHAGILPEFSTNDSNCREILVFGKKCPAVRIASCIGQEGRFAEHTLALCIRPSSKPLKTAFSKKYRWPTPTPSMWLSTCGS